MDWYARIQQARVGGGGYPTLGAGDYLLQVVVVKEHRGGQGGTFFIVELYVLQSTNPQHAQGTMASQVIRLDGKFPDTALGDVKGFLAAALGLSPTDQAQVDQQITPDVVRMAIRPENPLQGHILQANVWMKPPKQNPNGQPFAKFKWTPVLENGQPMRRPLPEGARPSQVQAPAQAAPQGFQGYGGAPQGFTPGAYQNAGGPPPQGFPGQFPPMGGAPAQAPQGFPGQAAPQLPHHPQAHMMGQGYVPNMAPPPGQLPVPQAAPAAMPWSPQAAPAAGPPQAAPAAPPQAQFPPAGWYPHPQAPGHFHDGQRVLSEAQLRALMATGQV